MFINTLVFAVHGCFGLCHFILNHSLLYLLPLNTSLYHLLLRMIMFRLCHYAIIKKIMKLIYCNETIKSLHYDIRIRNCVRPWHVHYESNMLYMLTGSITVISRSLGSRFCTNKWNCSHGRSYEMRLIIGKCFLVLLNNISVIYFHFISRIWQHRQEIIDFYRQCFRSIRKKPVVCTD